jgi:hypothetical protein
MLMSRRWWSGVALAAFGVLGGCGGDEQQACTNGPLTIDQGKRVVALTEAELKELCDWNTCLLGGYGAKLTCASGPAVRVAPSQSSCLASVPKNQACQATVADLVRCVQATRANPCQSTLLLGADCAAVFDFDCVTFTPNALVVAPMRLDVR